MTGRLIQTVLGLGGMVLCLLSLSVFAEVGYKERDYIETRKRQFQGIDPIIDVTFTLSVVNPKFPGQITFDMDKAKSILVKIEFEGGTPEIVMLASQTGTPRLLKAVWRHDDLRTPVVFWSSDFWYNDQICDATGCPRIRFQMIKGEAAITILAIR